MQYLKSSNNDRKRTTAKKSISHNWEKSLPGKSGLAGSTPSSLQTQTMPSCPIASCHQRAQASLEIAQQSKEDTYEIRKMRAAVLLSPFIQGSKGNLVV